MSDPVLPSPIRIRFQPYAHADVEEMLGRVRDDFGVPGQTRRWWFRSPADIAEFEHVAANVWFLDFYFQDPADAVIFSIKYQR